MKKYMILCASALLALAACTKVAPVAETQHEIGFQVASYATKANSALPEDTVFGAYSWYTNEAGTTVAQMTNEKVGKRGTEWKTIENTFYWPKTGSIDFISYSPWMENGPSEITATSLKFNAFKVGELDANNGFTANGVDLMYADKALKQTQNGTEYVAVSNVTGGVPTLFHHALANVSFKIQANFLEWTDPQTQSKTTWKVTVKSAKLNGAYTQGDLALTSTATAAAWTKPTDDVWTNLSAPVAFDLISAEDGVALTSKAKGETPTDLSDFGFVIPQKLGDAQTLTLVMDIETTQPNKVTFTQPNVTRTVKLNTGKNGNDAIAAWKMNQKIVYTILVKPTKGTNPDNPDDPTDDVITFDPAVAGWDEVLGATIQL